MKKILVAGIVLAAFCGVPALAADMPVKAPPPSVAAPTYSWTGFYGGGNAGGAWGNFDPSTVAVLNPVTGLTAGNAALVTALGTTLSIKPDAFVGGFQAGYNWQTANFVYGFEADIKSFHLSGNSTSAAASGPVTFTLGASASATWLATARGRVGVAANNWLFYATGGAAFTHLSGLFTYADTVPHTEAASFSNTKTGYTVGGGVEVGIWGSWTVKAEYLYVDFGSVSGSGNLSAPLGGQVLLHSIDLKANIARLGLNYRFF